MTVALVAHAITRSGYASAPSVATLNTIGANLALVGWSSYSANAGGGSPPISDSLGNTWHATQYVATNFDEVQAIYSVAPTVGSSHQVGPSGLGAGGYTAIAIAFFSGLDATSTSPTAVNKNGAASVTSIQPGSVAANAGDLIVTIVSQDDNSNSAAFLINSGFTIVDQAHPGDGSSRNSALAYLVAPTSGSYNPTWSGPTSADWDSCILVFKAAAGGSAVTGGGDGKIGSMHAGGGARLDETGGGVGKTGAMAAQGGARLDEAAGGAGKAGSMAAQGGARLDETAGGDGKVGGMQAAGGATVTPPGNSGGGDGKVGGMRAAGGARLDETVGGDGKVGGMQAAGGGRLDETAGGDGKVGGMQAAGGARLDETVGGDGKISAMQGTGGANVAPPGSTGGGDGKISPMAGGGGARLDVAGGGDGKTGSMQGSGGARLDETGGGDGKINAMEANGGAASTPPGNVAGGNGALPGMTGTGNADARLVPLRLNRGDIAFVLAHRSTVLAKAGPSTVFAR